MILKKIAERVLYGFGFGFGMGVSFKLFHKPEKPYKIKKPRNN